MEKKDLLGVRTKPAAVKRRRKVVAAAGGGGGRGRGLAKTIADYLASDSYMYAPLISDDPQHRPPAPPPAAACPASSEKKYLWCKNIEALGEVHLLPARSIYGDVGVVDGAVVS